MFGFRQLGRVIFALTMTGSLMFLGGTCWGQQNSDRRRDVLQNKKPDRMNRETADKKNLRGKMGEHAQNEQIALEFVREHHAELEIFLDELKDKFPSRFRRATAEIARQAKRLTEIETRNQKLYDYSIANWKVDSRIKLLAIKNAIDPDTKSEQQLKSLVRKQLELQHRRGLEERKRLRVRAERLDRQIRRYEAEPDSVTRQRIEQIKRRAKGQLRQVRDRQTKDRKQER